MLRQIHPLRLLTQPLERLLPAQHFEEFRRELVIVNLSRLRIISVFNLLVGLTIIALVDVMNLLNLSLETRQQAFVLHLVFVGSSIFSFWFSHVKRPSRSAIKPWHLRVIMAIAIFILLPEAFLISAIAQHGGSAVAAHIFVLTIWAATLVLPPRFALVALSVSYASVMTTLLLLDRRGAFTLDLDEVMVLTMVTIVLVLIVALNMRQTAHEFLQRTMIEEERNTIALLNAELASAYQEAEALNTNLAATLRALEAEQQKSEQLLLNILPGSIADRLKSGETLIADIHEEVTILFADIVGFTKLSAEHSAVTIVQILNTMFSIFDRLCERYQLEKIKTIGDAYMVVGGIPHHRNDHAEAVARMALDILDEVESFKRSNAIDLAVRIGMHSGSVVAGVIGEKKFIYDLWGDAVNTASRMESHGEASKIHCTDQVYTCLNQSFLFEERGTVDIKGKGLMRTWFLVGARS